MENSENEQLEDMYDDLIVDGVDEVPFAASRQQRMNMPSPKSDAKERYGIFPSYSCKSAASHEKFPKHIKLKKDIGIEDVVKEHALPFLPAKSLYRFKTVSKEWDQLINTPFFAHRQTTVFKDISGLFCQLPGESPFFLSLDPTAFGIPSNSTSLSFLPEHGLDIRTTCNGLLCCQSRYGDQHYYICNPVTEEWKRLPKPHYYHGPGTAIALAFEPSVLNFAATYELICVVAFPDTPVLHFEIYSSRSDSWRISETVYCELDALALTDDGFYMKGYTYWKTRSGEVLAFDVKYESYSIFSLPPCSGPTGALTEMHGNLCYLLPRKQNDKYIIEVYGDMNMSLKQVIALSPKVVENTDQLFRAVCYVNDDKFILDLHGKIIAYRTKAQKQKCIRNARNEGSAKYLPYVNNLVSVSHSVVSEWG